MKHFREVPKDWHEGLEEMMEDASQERTFVPFSILHPPFYDDEGKPHWRAMWTRIFVDTPESDLAIIFKDTTIALRWVSMVIRLRQEELQDKKLFADDPVLVQMRLHAIRLGHYRGLINQASQALARQPVVKSARVVGVIRPPAKSIPGMPAMNGLTQPLRSIGVEPQVIGRLMIGRNDISPDQATLSIQSLKDTIKGSQPPMMSTDDLLAALENSNQPIEPATLQKIKEILKGPKATGLYLKHNAGSAKQLYRQADDTLTLASGQKLIDVIRTAPDPRFKKDNA